MWLTVALWFNSRHQLLISSRLKLLLSPLVENMLKIMACIIFQLLLSMSVMVVQ